nr:MAG TPA: hypothetical protein [Caudoviricetes sp.]
MPFIRDTARVKTSDGEITGKGGCVKTKMTTPQSYRL